MKFGPLGPWSRSSESDWPAAGDDGAASGSIDPSMMPAFSSAGALDVLRKRAQDLPFLIVSGAAPEDVVTAAMRQGAHDFISKNNLVRLVPAVRRELKEAALRQSSPVKRATPPVATHA